MRWVPVFASSSSVPPSVPVELTLGERLYPGLWYPDGEASRAMMASIAKTVGGVFEIVSAVASAWYLIIIGGIAIPVALAFTYMLLLFLFAKTIIYGLLILLILALGAGIWLNKTAWRHRRLMWQLQAAVVAGGIGFIVGRFTAGTGSEE